MRIRRIISTRSGAIRGKSLNLLKGSKIDQAFAEAKDKKKGGKKHKVKWMRRPMVMPEAILEFLDENLRENAIRYLSNFLIEEVVSFYRKMSEKALNVRSIKRLANVLTLFQCIAANNGTRQKFVDGETLPLALIARAIYRMGL